MATSEGSSRPSSERPSTSGSHGSAAQAKGAAASRTQSSLSQASGRSAGGGGTAAAKESARSSSSLASSAKRSGSDAKLKAGAHAASAASGVSGSAANRSSGSGIRSSASSSSSSGGSSSSTSSSPGARGGKLKPSLPLGASVEMASDRSPSLRGARFAADDEHNGESQPLLKASGSSSSDGEAEKEQERLRLQAEARKKLRGQVTSISLTVIPCVLAVVVLVALGWGIYRSWGWMMMKFAEAYPPSCTLEDWTDWSGCSSSCGVAWESSTRGFYPPRTCRPQPEPVTLRRERLCELMSCPGIDCLVGAWTEWSPAECSEPCGPGQQTRVRQVLQRPDAVGRPCPMLYQQAYCELQPCSALCRLSEWTPWTTCSQSCALGEMSRTRSALLLEVGNALCPHLKETAPCQVGPCPASCSFLVPPDNEHAIPSSVLHCNGTSDGGHCHFQCKPGFQPEGPMICNQGAFVSRGCQPELCLGVPTVENGLELSSCRDYPSGSFCRLFCEPSFRPTGDLFCDHGNFSDHTCLALTCGEPPRIARARDESYIDACRGLALGQVCSHFECELGFTRSSDLLCVDGLNFNHPRCEEAACTEPPPSTQHLSAAADLCGILAKAGIAISSRTICEQQCEQGYVQKAPTVCFRGQWFLNPCVPEDTDCSSNDTICGNTTCSEVAVPEIEGALTATCSRAASGGTCELHCDGDREKWGGDLFCAGGQWWPPVCRVPACFGRPILEHVGDLSACIGASHGEACELYCELGFAPTEPQLHCDRGTWRGGTCDSLLCKYPAVPAHAVGNYSVCEHLYPGDYCPLYCEEGYEAVPPEGFRCMDGGRFERAHCQPRSCNTVPNVAHSADVGSCRGAASGSYCELTCMPGYLQVGDLFCNLGRWTDASCYKLSKCEAVPMIANAEKLTFDCIDTPDDSSCKFFRCAPGYEPSGPLQCSNGYFSMPRCVEAGCREAPWVLHSAFDPEDCRDLSSGDICTVNCDSDYSTTGELVCSRGSFNMVSCRGPVEELAANEESVSLALLLPITYEAWARRSRGTALGARLGAALAEVASVEPRRVLERGYRPETASTCVVDLDLLPATLPAGLSARQAAAAAQQSLRSGSGALATLLGPALAAGAQLTVIRSSIGKMCTDLPEVPGAEGLAKCAYTLPGKECPLVCKLGTVRSGHLVCMGGFWSRAQCVPAPCTSPPEVANAENVTHCVGTENGGSCEVVCLPGNIPSGAAECRGGKFTEVECVPQACKYSPVLTLAVPEIQVQCRRMESGGLCKFRCAPGYFPSGQGAFGCDRGNWQALGSCSPAACYYRPVVVHSFTDLTACAGTEHGEECVFLCEQGFAQKGNLRCMYGQFEPVRCVPLPCTEPPEVPGLVRELAETCVPATSGSACLADCGPGRKLSHPLVCRYGRWTRTACTSIEAKLLPCKYAPIVPRAADVSMCIGTPADGKCQPTCSSGYELDGDVVCGNGTWTTAACEPRHCGHPASKNSIGMGACMDLGHGSLCPIRCLPGYSPGGLSVFTPEQMEPLALARAVLASSIECRAGEWQGPSCLEAPCDSVPPGIKHAEDLSHCAGTASRKTCTIQCATGYYAAGFPQCVKGAWRGLRVARCEEAPCTDYPSVLNSADLNHCINRPSRSECPLACARGYYPTGTLLCLRGVWLLAQCIAHCDSAPTGINNAVDLSHCAGRRVGSYCELVCSLGFRASGDLHCGEGGQWELAFCYEVAHALTHAAEAQAQVDGLRVGANGELDTAVDSLHRALAAALHLPTDLVSAKLEATETANSFRLLVWALCSDCTQNFQRFKRVLSEAASVELAAAWRTELCGELCPPTGGQACTQSCEEEQSQLSVSLVGEVRVVDSGLTAGGGATAATAVARALTAGIDRGRSAPLLV